MKVTLKITAEKKRDQSFNKPESVTLVEFAEVEFSNSLTANVLRAVADEMDPQYPSPSQFAVACEVTA